MFNSEVIESDNNVVNVVNDESESDDASYETNESNEELTKFQEHITKSVMDLNVLFQTQTIEYENTKKLLDTTRHELETIKTQLSQLTLKTKNLKLELNNTKLEFQQKIKKSTPPGTIAYFADKTAPDGWLKANGQSVSRILYSKLFETIGTTYGSGDDSTTFTLPDLRGEFIRGWSDGRDVDKDRKFGSFQWGSSIPMAGYIDGQHGRLYSSAYHDRWGFAGQTFDNGFEINVKSGQSRDGITFPNDGHGNYVAYCSKDRNGYITTWNVCKGTRPRNIALLACIKY